jgi:iron complex transport system permease protein
VKTEARPTERRPETAAAPAARPRSLMARLVALVAGLGSFLIVTIVLAANIGAEHVPLSVVVDSVQRYFAGRPPGPQAALATIFWQLRLPRVALGAVVGLALTVAGGSLQGLLMNPLADPYLVGVSAGAAFGASAAVVLSSKLHVSALGGGPAKSLIGFAAGALTMLIVLWLARSRRGLQRDAFILAGVVVGSFLWALVTLLMTLSGSDLYTIVYWLMGNLSSEGNWAVIGVAAALVLVGCVLLYSYARDLNVLALGEEQAWCCARPWSLRPRCR